jgi:hypothetical protein
VSALVRSVGPAVLGALCLCLLPCAARAQNGANYHVLSNGVDTMYAGVGLGGSQTQADGLGTWIAGEDLRGSHVLDATGDFGYLLRGVRETACLPFISAGPQFIRFRGLFFLELDGLNGNAQAVFTNPACPSPGPSFPLGGSAGFIPYGVGPGSTRSFVVAGLPPGTGPAPSSAILLPNNGLVPSTAGGSADFVGTFTNIALPLMSTSFCWGVQFTFVPTAIALHDDIDGLWHYVINSDDYNQYWGFSNDELNLWQSNSVASDAGLTAVVTFPPNADYDLLLLSAQPTTIATLAPVGVNLDGAYDTQTGNVQNEYGVTVNPNGGFDVGRGSSMISLSGTAGVPNPTTGLGNQNPATNPGKVPTLGFLTFDNGGDQNGSVRLTWVSVDLLGQAGGDPALDPGLTKFGGAIRVPVVSAGFPQALTRTCATIFGHVTQPGFPDPSGYTSGAFGVPGIAGASGQIPVGTAPAVCIGLPFNLTYGTSGRTGVLGAPGSLTFDPSVADTSGTRELYLFN